MNRTTSIRPIRVLVVDDNPTIHEDFRKILLGHPDRERVPDALANLEAALLDEEVPQESAEAFDLDSAFQGREGLEKVQAALHEGQPYVVAFVDMRMPPGWDGVETITHLWKTDPALQVVICTAYSDYSWSQIIAQLDGNDNLTILKKPFDNVEVAQLARALAKKWCLARQVRELRRLVQVPAPISQPVTLPGCGMLNSTRANP